MPSFSADLQDGLDSDRAVLAGCTRTGADPRWSCNNCGVLFGLPGEKGTLSVVERRE